MSPSGIRGKRKKPLKAPCFRGKNHPEGVGPIFQTPRVGSSEGGWKIPVLGRGLDPDASICVLKLTNSIPLSEW